MSETHPPPTPHGPLMPVCDGVWCVRGTFRMAPGLVISRTMTIARAPDGLVLVSSVRLDERGLAELAALGPVAHVVSLSPTHGIDDPFYVTTFGAAYWVVPGARPRLPTSRPLGPEAPIPGARVVPIPVGAGAPPESALWLPAGGGTLVTCDAVQNHVDKEGASFLARVMTPLLGFKGGVIVPRIWRRVHKLTRAAAPTALAALAALDFEHLVTAHGPPVVGGAAARVRAAVGVGA